MVSACACDSSTTNAGQILVLAAQAVTEPRAHARPARLLESGLDEGDRGIVIDRVGVHRLDERDVIDDLRRCAAAARSPTSRSARAARTRKSTSRPASSACPIVCGDALALADGVGNLRALVLGEARLVVERLELRRPAGLVQEDDALRLRREVRKRGEPAGLRIAVSCSATPAASSSGESSDPSAAAPMPRAVRPNSCRRVKWQIDFAFDASCRRTASSPSRPDSESRSRPSSRPRARSGSSRLSRADSPTREQLRRGLRGSAPNDFSCVSRSFRSTPRLLAGRLARRGQAERIGEARLLVLAAFEQRALRPARARPRRRSDR